MLGNGNKSIVTIGIAALGLHFPHLYSKMIWHYNEGKKAVNICHLRFYDIVDLQVTDLRKQYNLKLIKNKSY
jgi:hypothetical protein